MAEPEWIKSGLKRSGTCLAKREASCWTRQAGLTSTSTGCWKSGLGTPSTGLTPATTRRRRSIAWRCSGRARAMLNPPFSPRADSRAIQSENDFLLVGRCGEQILNVGLPVEDDSALHRSDGDV